jgi:hypothetical protein
LPFDGQYHTAMNDVLQGRYRPLLAQNPAVPAELAEVVGCALKVNRDERYWTALKMEETLRRFLVRADPEFSTHALKAFVWWVFEEELEREGITQSITRQERAQIERWLIAETEARSSPHFPGPTAPQEAVRTAERGTRPERPAASPATPTGPGWSVDGPTHRSASVNPPLGDEVPTEPPTVRRPRVAEGPTQRQPPVAAPLAAPKGGPRTAVMLALAGIAAALGLLLFRAMQ